VLRPDRVVALLTLALLNAFAIGAGIAVVQLTPRRDLAPLPPAVATREIIRADATPLTTAAPKAPAGSSAPAASVPNGAALAARLNGLLGGAGSNINAVVIDAATRRTLYDQRAGVAATPASTTKLATSVAALATLGPDRRFTTKVVRGPAESPAGGSTGTSADRIVLVGGGDPTLTLEPAKGYPAYASLTVLAERTAAALKSTGTTRVTVDHDISLYSGSRTAPGWKPNYLPDGEVAPVTALMVNEGRITRTDKHRVSDPPSVAAEAFTRLLRANRIDARQGAQTRARPAAAQLAAVQSPPVSVLVEHALTVSDNDVAEALARQVAIARKRPSTFDGGAHAVEEALARLGVGAGVDVSDGSGLSPRNRITPMALANIAALAASTRRPELRAAITGLPVAGFSGTLADRYTVFGAQGAGLVRAKTGTLAGVSTLAGVVYDADGRLLAFAFMADKVNGDVTGTLDQLAAAVAECGCR
jgi:serine-type D-Ala-D-Ala carboxypeptidase/endopeptidase (penicillin-binding protein 4)